MKILLNGETYQCEDDSLYGLLKSVNVLEKRFAVEVDGNIIPSSLYKKYKLKWLSSLNNNIICYLKKTLGIFGS